MTTRQANTRKETFITDNPEIRLMEFEINLKILGAEYQDH